MVPQDNTSTMTGHTSSEVVPVESPAQAQAQAQAQAPAQAQEAQRGGIREATLEELVAMIEQGRDSNGRPWANEDLAAIQTRMEHWQRLRDSLAALKRKGRDNDNDNDIAPKRIDIKYESVEILTLRSSIRAWTN